MSKGVIYICSTVVDGLIKIGKSNINNFEERMRKLEKDGYHNVSGHKREFAIVVDHFDEKEIIIHDVLANSRVGNSELFSVNLESAIKLLSSFEGEMIFPKDKTKDELFEEAVKVAEEEEQIEEEQKRTRTSKPKFNWMVEQGIIKIGDFVFYKKKKNEKAKVISKDKVEFNGEKISILDFTRKVTGWKSVCAYRLLTLERENKTLDELREAKLKELNA